MSDEENPVAPEEAEASGDAAAAPAEDLSLRELETTAPDEGAAAADSVQTEGGEDEEDFLHTAADLEAVFDIPVRVSAILGKSHLQVSELLKLSEGAVIELDRKVGEAIDIFVNNRLVARGEVVLVEDRLGVTMTEIIKTE